MTSPNKPNHQGEGGGRPRRWQSEGELASAIAGYFDGIDQEPEEGQKPKPPGLFALCVDTGMSYDCLLDYESGIYDDENNKFSETIKKARLMIAAFAEEQIYERTAGATFQLVNLTRKFREPYKNAQHQEITGPNNGPVQVSITQEQAGVA